MIYKVLSVVVFLEIYGYKVLTISVRFYDTFEVDFIALYVS